MIGVVTRLHDEAPPVEARLIEVVLDQEPILNPELMELAAWIAQYDVAPLGEVLRSMLPLMAEVRRSTSYRISETGRAICSTAPSRVFAPLAPHCGRTEHRIDSPGLSFRLATGKERNLTPCHRSDARAVDQHAAQEVAAARDGSRTRDARRLVRYAVLVADARPPKLNENQLAILAELAGAGGSLPVPALRRLGSPATTLQTLVRRGLVTIEERPAAFHLSAAGLPTQHELNHAQQAALG